MKSILCGLAAVFLLAAPAAAKPSAADFSAIVAYETKLGPAAAQASLAARMAELKVPGVSIAFIEDGKVTWTRTYGVATAGGKPVTPATMFQAASMSKPLAAVAALRLVEQGRLDLDKDINSQISAWQVPPSSFSAEKKVTLRALLSHSAGMTVSGFPGYAAGKPVPATVQILNGEPPSNTPAVRSFETPGKYAYSGGGFTVAQLAIVEAGGRTYGRLLDDLVLGPAGMRQSTLAQPLPPTLRARSASGHDAKGVALAGGSNTYPEYAAAGLWTTPSDYGRFLISLQDSFAGRRGGLLRQATAETMMTPVDGDYGLGLQLGRYGGHPFIQHSGGNAGFRCVSFAFLDGTRRGVVIMTNGDGGGWLTNEVMLALVEAYGWGGRDKDTPGSPRRAPNLPAPGAK